MPAFTLWTEQQVLLAVVRGPWSDLIARDYAEAYRHAVQPLLNRDWAHIVYLDDWGLGSPDIEPIIKNLADWAVTNRLRYFAQVFSPNMVKQYQLNRMLISNLGTCEKRTFAHEADAFGWLNELGFATDSKAPLAKRA